MSDKQIVAVIFGGRSVEHDVSILTGLQFLEALNPTLYVGLPIYVDPQGTWWTGEALYRRSYYPISDTKQKALTPIQLDLATPANGRARVVTQEKGFLGNKQSFIEFDIMVPAIHGSNGEDGTLQGLLDFAAIPYTGCRLMGAALTMDKIATKARARDINVPTLPECKISKPAGGTYLDEDQLKTKIADQLAGAPYPYCVKPCNLGSSVGVSKADDFDGLMAALLLVFRMDSAAMIEPFVNNLVEYNIAVRRGSDGIIHTSAIERPSSESEVLDFKNKYLAGGKAGGKTGAKLDSPSSEGMAGLNRTLNPSNLSKEQENTVRSSAAMLFNNLELAGSVRIDYLSDSQSGMIWFNEINTIPGSFAYFLWEGATDNSISFLELTTEMIKEGFTLSKQRLGNTSSSVGGSIIFNE